MQIAGIPNFGAPHFRAEHSSTGLEVSERLGEPTLSEPKPCSGGRGQNGTDTGRPAVLWQKGEQRLCVSKLTRLDRDISQHGRDEREPGSKITLSHHFQGD